jgi:hypothetical protein
MAEAADDPIIAALLRERSGYVLAGRTDRAGQVDEQLALLGWKPEPSNRPPKGRSPRRRQTT